MSEAARRTETAHESGDFFARARTRLSLSAPASLIDPTADSPRGDHDLDPAVWAAVGRMPSRQAAVLIPVIDRTEPAVLLTVRSTRLPDHAGQIAFPGGKIDASDASPAAAALREAEEEIGLEARLIEPIGYLDLYLTTTGYRVLPTVARVAPGFTLRLNPAEVDDAFEVPLPFLMGAENHQQHSREWKGIIRTYYAMPFGERYIWGVTAGILRNLYERLYR